MRTVFGIVLALLLGGPAAAAEVKAFIAEAFRGAMDVIATDYEKASGNKLTVVYGTAGALRDRIRAGEPVDVALLPRSSFDPLLADRKLVGGTEAPISQALIALAVRAGSPKPDISTPDALRSSLLAARAIGHSDPAFGGAIGQHAVKVIEQLGITQEMRPKTKMTRGGEFHELLATGEVDLVFGQPMTVMRDARLELVGPLPAQLQDVHNFLYLAAVTSNAADPAAARSLVQYLASPAAARVIKAKGMEPKTAP